MRLEATAIRLKLHLSRTHTHTRTLIHTLSRTPSLSFSASPFRMTVAVGIAASRACPKFWVRMAKPNQTHLVLTLSLSHTHSLSLSLSLLPLHSFFPISGLFSEAIFYKARQSSASLCYARVITHANVIAEPANISELLLSHETCHDSSLSLGHFSRLAAASPNLKGMHLPGCTFNFSGPKRQMTLYGLSV